MQRKENENETFTIDETNRLAIHATQKDVQAVPMAEHFSTLENLTSLAANWPGARLIEIWNKIPGNTPVAKFKDRGTGVTRIWKAIQTLEQTHELADRASAPVAEAIQVEEAEAPAATPATEPNQESAALEVEVQKEATEPAGEEVQPEAPADAPQANVGEQTPDVAPAEPAATKKATRKQKAPTGEKDPKGPREESKTSRVIEMLKREGGTTLEEIMTAMGWQKHTTRASTMC